MKYISFDVANKSLAISIINYTSDDIINTKLSEAFKVYKKNKSLHLKTNPMSIIQEYATLLQKCNNILKDRIHIEYLNVIDLIPNKKISETTIVERTFLLNKVLNDLKDTIINLTKNDDFKFLIEYQMGPNDKSRTISSQLLLFCSSFMLSLAEAENRIKLVGPSLKNKLSLQNDEKSYHAYYLDKYKTNYAANKNHTKYILKKIISAYGQNNILKDIKKKNIDDAADAVCMTIAYIIYNT